MRLFCQMIDEFRSDSGATSIEYALIATLISIAVIGGVTASGGSLQASLENTLSQIVAAFG
ncbi:MAG TPA: Flp family type IVb pilin [Phenylobacterium sp.]|nr:Flp family type IVb pilin [Phenylobacterium sp.]